MLAWQRIAAVFDSPESYALLLRTCNPSMRCRDWLMVGLPVGLPVWLPVGLLARWACGAAAWMPALRCTAVSLAAAVPLIAAAAPRFSGTAFGLRPALAKSRRNGHAGTQTQRVDTLPEPA